MSLVSQLRAGGVVRYHAIPELPKQTIAEHTWRLMRFLRLVWEDVPDHVVRHAECHDMDELFIGDIPAPIKRELGEDSVEHLFTQLAQGEYPDHIIGDVLGSKCEAWERAVVSFCDRMELVDYCLPYSTSPVVQRVVQRGLSYAKTHLEDVKTAPLAPQRLIFNLQKLWSTYDN